MAAIRWVCLSDLHLGALNSVLTPVGQDGERVDSSSVSPVLVALCDALRTLSQGIDPPQLVILGDLFEMALGSPDDAAATFAQFIAALRPGAADAAVAPAIRFLPGNHDHYLWTRARGDRYLEYIKQAPSTQALTSDAHNTHLLPSNETLPVRDRFIELLAARADPDTAITVEQSYPSLGLVTTSGQRAVVLSHGHFIEPLYRVMSSLIDVFKRRQPGMPLVHHLEAENGAWIDFFWSSMGDSGDVSGWAREMYESLQSEEAIDAEIQAIGRAIANRPGMRVRNHIEGLLAEGTMARAVSGSLRRERHVPEVLSVSAQAGLLTFLSGPVASQVADEIGAPAEVVFVFGHTHKPFADLRQPSRLPGPVPVINTGGWVVDTQEAEPNKGASVILIDEDLNIATLRCYTQGAELSHDVEIEGPPNDPDNPLVTDLRARIDPSRDPWRALAEAATATERERRHQLEARLQAETIELDTTSRRHPWRRRGFPTSPPSPPATTKAGPEAPAPGRGAT
jgi:UDP-2,3-diacylglucosamine pyrophosphatase LpxH